MAAGVKCAKSFPGNRCAAAVDEKPTGGVITRRGVTRDRSYSGRPIGVSLSESHLKNNMVIIKVTISQERNNI